MSAQAPSTIRRSIRPSSPRLYPALRDPRYAKAPQWLSEVQGDSVNKLNIFDGDLVHVVDAIAIGYYPLDGDIVEVERLRYGGLERELTIKQVEVTPSGWLLWPRSTNPRYQDPIEILNDGEPAEGTEVRIRGLVVRMHRVLSRG